MLVSLKWPERPRDRDPDEPDTLRVLEDRDKAPSAPAVLKKAGVQFALYSDGIDSARDLSTRREEGHRRGLSREDALRAMTLSPAEIYGVADRLGSIEKGKIANLVVTQGDLFEDRTRSEMVFIDGSEVHAGAPTRRAARRSGRRMSRRKSMKKLFLAALIALGVTAPRAPRRS